MGILKNRSIIILILLALLIRLLLINLPGFRIDVGDWYSWSMRLNETGFSKFYNDQVFSDYPPGYMYVLSFLGSIKNVFSLNDADFYLLLKIPAIIAEIMIGILIYQILYKYLSSFYASLGAAFVIFNPALIFNSTIWGQVDSISALFMLAAIYFLQNKKLVLSAFLLGISFLIKPQTIAIFPIYLLYLLKNFSLKNLSFLALPFLLSIFVLSLPFFPGKPFTGLISLITKTANGYPYTSLFAYNLWGAIGFWIKDSQLWNNISYQNLSYLLFISYWVILSYLYLKKNISTYSLATLATLGFFFLPTRVHERYLYPAIPFLILVAILYKSRLLIFLTGLLSLLHFFNLYYVYVYYNELYLKLPKILYNPLIFNLLEISSKNLSSISLIIFIFISIIIFRNYANFKKA